MAPRHDSVTVQAGTHKALGDSLMDAMADDVLLVTMPFGAIDFPSIQLGTVKALLTAGGISASVRHYNVTFAEHVIVGSRDLPSRDAITLSDMLSTSQTSLGDWIFSVAPFREPTLESDAACAALVANGSRPDGEYELSVRLRGFVPDFLAKCVDDILATNVRVVGFSSSFNQNVASLVLAKMLKQRVPEMTIVFGGANCDGPMGAALHRMFPWVDVVVRGEAERVTVPLFTELVAGRPPPDLPGLCVRRDRVSVANDFTEDLVAMRDVPIPDYDDYAATLEASPLQDELLRYARLLYESSRGCWWGEKNHCTFCGVNGSVMKFRSKPAAQTYRELMVLAKTYGLARFQAVDNIIDLAYISELLPRLRDSGWDWDVFYETKANLKKDQLRLFRDAGVRHIQPGVESLSTPILRLMKKGITALQNIRLLKWCAEIGIEPAWNLIYGFPGEPADEYARMAELIPSLIHLRPPNVSPLAIERFSPYHRDPDKHGIEIIGPAKRYELCYPPFSREDMLELAYQFEYRHADGRTPKSYAQPVIDAIGQWREKHSKLMLQYTRGPDSLVIDDHRPTVAAARYTFEEGEAEMYLACDAGATPVQVQASLARRGHHGYTVEDIREFLDSLVEMRLMYVERERYLALALARFPERAAVRDLDLQIDDDVQDDGRGEQLITLRRARAS